MTLPAGTRLGPYEILSPLGAGGMGEVYRAKDPRLGRDVAIKVLPATFSADAERLRRFEQEARAAGLLNHPNITAVYDIGFQEGAPYVVQELLEGESLRLALIAGRLSVRQAVDYASQIAMGLAAAHDKGIVHRDLKPENLFVTRDGRVKILDFGLAKLIQRNVPPDEETSAPTATVGTEPGLVMGTVGYMSPEQVRGKPANAASDIFSFGAVLYEMLSGKRAFQGESAADTMSAILREDPPDLSVSNQNISPGLEGVLRHCLEKAPEQRFQSARDLAFNLGALSATSGQSIAATVSARQGRRASRKLFAAVTAAALVALAFWAGRRGSTMRTETQEPTYRRLTFQRGNVLQARFTADGQSVAYSASWGNQPAEIFLARVGSRESRALGIPNANVLSVSSADELAVLLKTADLFGSSGRGTLARIPVGGGAPRQILESVYEADWSPDGRELAVLRSVDGQKVLDYPIGKRLVDHADSLSSARVSPDGSLIAAVDYSDQPSVVTFDRSGKRRVLARGFWLVDTLAWHPSGKEVWFDGVALNKGGAFGAVFAVDMAGHTRTVARTVDMEVVHDIARDGSVLIEREIATHEILFGAADTPGERNLSWLDQSQYPYVSNDGRMLLFTEYGEGGGVGGSVYLRTTDGAPAARLGDGQFQDLSPDGRWALTLSLDGTSFVLLPTAAGAQRTIPLPKGLIALAGSFVPPDGKRIGFPGIEAGHGARGYVMDTDVGKPRAFTPEGLTGEAALSPDGKSIALNGSDNRPRIYPFSGGEIRSLPGLEPGDIAIQWGSDGDTLYLRRSGELPQRVYRYSIASGTKTLWKELMPADRTGLIGIDKVSVTPDGKHYAYSVNRVTNSDLYVVTGWK